jgi:hypothetical protein
MFNPPVAASGPRSPEKRRPLPKHVKLMIELMVRGRPDDPDGAPLSFIEAGKIAGLAPHRARQWLDRAEARSFLRAERRAYRDALCAANEHHLARIRGGPNAAAGVRAIQVLEGLEEADTHRNTRGNVAPGLVVVIQGAMPKQPLAPVVDITPEPPDDAV